MRTTYKVEKAGADPVVEKEESFDKESSESGSDASDNHDGDDDLCMVCQPFDAVGKTLDIDMAGSSDVETERPEQMQVDTDAASIDIRHDEQMYTDSFAKSGEEAIVLKRPAKRARSDRLCPGVTYGRRFRSKGPWTMECYHREDCCFSVIRGRCAECSERLWGETCLRM